MPFEHDVFISYPHLSNKDDTAGQNGWVAKFHRDLENKLTQALGREAVIWRDSRMPSGTKVVKAIANHLSKSKALVCVISPAYLNSPWCRDELEQFRKLAEQNGGLTVGEQLRVIVVVQLPAPINELDLCEGLHSKFYDSTHAGVHVPYSLTYKNEQYEQNLWGIAWALKPIIENLADGQVDTTRTIYLAESTSDRQIDRKRIAEELKARNYIVLPKEDLDAKTFQEYSDAVEKELKRAFMSIHLLGESVGPIPEKAKGKSTVQIQCELAADRCSTDPSFKRVLWIPDKLPDLEEDQAAFLKNVRTKDADVPGTAVHERPFDDFTTRLLQILTKTLPKPKADGRVRIYIMCDKRDVGSVAPVGKYLHRKGYEVMPPPDSRGAVKRHIERLVGCDAALTIYGEAKQDWVWDRYDEVQDKIKGWGRETPISCSAILRTDPKTPYKELLFFHASKILEPPCYGGLSDDYLEKPLNEFIEELEQKLRREMEA